MTLRSGLDLNDLYEWEGLVGQCRRCEEFTAHGGNKNDLVSRMKLASYCGKKKKQKNENWEVMSYL